MRYRFYTDIEADSLDEAKHELDHHILRHVILEEGNEPSEVFDASEIGDGRQTVPDNRVLHVWACPDEDCEQKDEPYEFSPTFYQENGTPVCSCGVDMTYRHTVVESEALNAHTREDAQ